MTNSITLSSALQNNLLSLQTTQTSENTIQEQLATGKKVNSALDNPLEYYQSQSLTNLSGGLGNLLDGMGQAIQAITATTQGITSLTQLVQQAQSITQSATSSLQSSGMLRSGDISSTDAANLTANGSLFAAGGNFTLTANGGTAQTITVTAGETLQQLATAISAISGFSAQVVAGSSTSASGSVRLEIRATGGQTLALTNGTATAATIFQANNAGAGGVVGETGAGLGIVSGTAISISENTVNEVSLESQFNTIMTQINQLLNDAGYQGTNLLDGGTLNVQFNTANSSNLTVSGVTDTYSNLGITNVQAGAFVASPGGTDGGAGTGIFLNQSNINTASSQLQTALTTLQGQSQTFGNNLTVIQTRQNFTNNLINTLNAGSSALVNADTNQAGADLLALQTQQQLGIESLSLASQANQSVLRLFG